jgi:hypothetical protein
MCLGLGIGKVEFTISFKVYLSRFWVIIFLESFLINLPSWCGFFLVPFDTLQQGTNRIRVQGATKLPEKVGTARRRGPERQAIRFAENSSRCDRQVEAYR